MTLPTFFFGLHGKGRGMRESLQQLLEEEVQTAGFRLYSWTLKPGRRRRTLQIFLYADGGVGLDDCAIVSRRISRALDEEDSITGSYVLEVSSPGLDRPLFEPWHFEVSEGHRVRLIQEPQSGEARSVEGTLRGLDGEDVLLETPEREERLALETISKARLVPDLKPRRSDAGRDTGGER